MSLEFLTVAEAAEKAKCHYQTVADALRAGTLHGAQRIKAGKWRIASPCLEAWMLNEPCPHAAVPATFPVAA